MTSYRLLAKAVVFTVLYVLLTAPPVLLAATSAAEVLRQLEFEVRDIPLAVEEGELAPLPAVREILNARWILGSPHAAGPRPPPGDRVPPPPGEACRHPGDRPDWIFDVARFRGPRFSVHLDGARDLLTCGPYSFRSYARIHPASREPPRFQEGPLASLPPRLRWALRELSEIELPVLTGDRDLAASRTLLGMGVGVAPTEEEVRAALELAGRVSVPELIAGLHEFAFFTGRLLEALLEEQELVRRLPSHEADLPGTVRGDLIAVQEVPPWGLVVIGGAGPTEYRRAAALIIDVGGDDRYLAPVAGGRGGARVVIDLEGDDLYRSEEEVGLGAGHFGIGILIDLQGDDRYRGGVLSQGAALFGAGILHDGGGDDSYELDRHGQGAGIFGAGILVDAGGDDSYQAALAAQGFGGVRGLGVLHDLAGDDTYLAGGKYEDFREAGHYLSLSQGAGIGWRPGMTGGIGLLVDDSGNDAYAGDYFAQGVGYWFGVGVLFDGGGSDRYHARRYSQGAGVHRAAGLLIEARGNDRYTSWGVSQGCGHDHALGYLSERGGDDEYRSAWLSQGAGNMNGVGVLLDARGNDTYQSDKTSQGYGDESAGSKSLGLLVDTGGRDRYSLSGQDDSRWRESIRGAALDVDRRSK